MSCITAANPQLAQLAEAIARRVGQQRFSVWFNNSTKLDLKNDGLEIAVPSDFIGEMIGKRFTAPIQQAVNDVMGCSMTVRFHVVPQLFETDGAPRGRGEALPVARPGEFPSGPGGRDLPPPSQRAMVGAGVGSGGGCEVATAVASSAVAAAVQTIPVRAPLHNTVVERRPVVERPSSSSTSTPRPRLRHEISSFVVGPSNQLAYNTALYVAEFPGAQYNPLFIHGGCGLGKTHLLQGLCKQFQAHHPTLRWSYVTGEEFTNDFLAALRNNKLEVFRRKMRDLDLLAIDDVHFLAGKKATQEEFLHTFNSIEAGGKQVVMASDSHPKMIEEFGESLVNRFVSGMVVRVDPPNFTTRCEILRKLSHQTGFELSEEVTGWIARRVTQNVRELEGAVTRIAAYVRLGDRVPDVTMVQEALGDLDRQLVAPVKPDSIIQ
ncbi:MAG: chromosomal replication initiator protein DnaA, partial [Tepidisphaeraceae bacterium]